MPALTKAQKKQAQAAVDSFNRTYAAIYGEERWYQSLYPALAAPTRYAALVNRYATTTTTTTATDGDEGLNNVLTPEQKSRVKRIVFPTISDASSTSQPGSGWGLEAYQWEDKDKDKDTSLSSSSSSSSEVAAPAPAPAVAEEIFPPPQPSPSTGLMTHWNLDAASLLAVHVLAPRPGDKVLDLCAAPGGKSVAISQLLLPRQCHPESSEPSSPSSSSSLLAGGCLHSNEVNHGRNKRLAANLKAYLPASLFTFNKDKTASTSTTTTSTAQGTAAVIGEEVKVLKIDGSETSLLTLQKSLPLVFSSSSSSSRSSSSNSYGYDKVLLDAPCSSERHIIHASLKQNGGHCCDEMTSWRSTHSKKLAKTQVALLMNALRVLKTGGRVLYATCSLSDEENDGVVEKARELVQKERKKLGVKWDFVVVSDEEGKDGKEGGGGGGLESWAEKTKYGWLVLPDHPSGGRWGPLFFALLEKVEV